MKDKRSELSVFQAYRLYTGDGLLENIFMFSASEMLLYFVLSCSNRFAFFSLSEQSFFDTLKIVFANLSRRDESDLFSCMIGLVVGIGVLLIQRYDKSTPGGKFFHTVKGGFDTFKKYRVGVFLSILIPVILCATEVFLFDRFEIIGMDGGIVYSICIVTAVVFALIAYCFISRIKNKISSAVIGFLTIIICVLFFGVLVMIEAETLVPYIIIFAIGIVLLLISMRSYFSFYKRVYWD